MRKVKLAAIQPKYLDIPEVYNCLLNNYTGNSSEIVEHYVLPQLEVTLKLLKKAGEAGCDIVTTSENLTGTAFYSMDIEHEDTYNEILKLSYPIAFQRISEIAKKYGMYIVACYNKRIGDHNHNVAEIFDRKGKICASYSKTHLPSDEKWHNSEGQSIDVFELDFGKVGICICYDIMFPEVTQVLALKGAEVIFHPTAGYGWYDSIGEATLRTRANDNSVYIVTAKNYIFNGAGKSGIVDFWGHILADAGFYENVVVSTEIDLDMKKTQPDWYNPSVMSGEPNVTLRKLAERRPELYTPISMSKTEKLTVPDKAQREKIVNAIKSGSCRW